MATDLGQVSPNTEIFLWQPNQMLSLGTFAQARARAPPGTNEIRGINGNLLGNFGTPQIQNNLFIRTWVNEWLEGSNLQTGHMYRILDINK